MNLESVQQILDEHTALIGASAGLSFLLLIGSVLFAPWLLCRLPVDYFHNPHHRPLESLSHHPALRWPLVIAKNLLGVLLLLAGIAMLILPGQGILTIIMALVLLDFPGKFACKRTFIGIPRVADWINRLRRRVDEPPFQPKGTQE